MTESAILTGWDWFLLLVVLASVGLGLWRGLIRTVFGLAAWVAALVGTPWLGPTMIDAFALRDHPWVVLAVLFVALLLVVRLLGWGVARLLGKVGLGGIDRLLGAVFGVARALLVVLIAAVAAHALELDQRAAWKLSYSRPLLDAFVGLAGPYLPRRINGIRET
jgi:membrane protein required for colicin V production